MKKFVIAIFASGLTFCNQPHPKGETKTMDFGAFTVETPKTWKQVEVQGTDSYVGEIALEDNDTLYFDLGRYSFDLTEYQEVRMADGKTYYISSYDSAHSPTLFDSANKDKVVKSNFMWDNIDGKRAKILSPIKAGTGTTGIYIDSLRRGDFGIDHFNLYGFDLKPHNNKAALTAFKTLKFHNAQ